jgi:hypothetical protein
MDDYSVTINTIIIGLVIFLMVYLLLTALVPNKGSSPSGTGSRPGLPPVDWISTPHSSGKYGDTSPGKRLLDLYEELGPPSILDPRSGGLAIWYKRDLDHSPTGKCFEEIMIRDEQIPHGNPANHTDFLYTQYKLCVPEDLVEDIRSLSTSVVYDPLKCWIRARCHFLGANVATLFLAKKIATREISGKAARSEYGNQIKKAASNPEAYENMLEYLCDTS